MKKYLLSLVCILLFVSMNEVYSQCCANPLDEVTITRVVTVAGVPCTVDITFCHVISPLGIRYIKICSVNIPFGCAWNSVDLSSSTFWDLIYHELLVYSNGFFPFPPCEFLNQFSVNVEITKADCWRIENDYAAQQSILIKCDGEPSTCYKEFRICWDNGVLTKTIISSRLVGDSECFYEGGVFIDPNNPYPYCFDTCY